MTSSTPTLRLERQLLRAGHALVAGMDEVGRGALAGPVSVGVSVVDAATSTVPQGVKDSKLVPEPRRPDLARRVRRWALDGAVGHAGGAQVAGADAVQLRHLGCSVTGAVHDREGVAGILEDDPEGAAKT